MKSNKAHPDTSNKAHPDTISKQQTLKLLQPNPSNNGNGIRCTKLLRSTIRREIPKEKATLTSDQASLIRISV
eukprot:1121270-Amphidinium_carterae.1